MNGYGELCHKPNTVFRKKERPQSLVYRVENLIPSWFASITSQPSRCPCFLYYFSSWWARRRERRVLVGLMVFVVTLEWANDHRCMNLWVLLLWSGGCNGNLFCCILRRAAYKNGTERRRAEPCQMNILDSGNTNALWLKLISLLFLVAQGTQILVPKVEFHLNNFQVCQCAAVRAPILLLMSYIDVGGGCWEWGVIFNIVRDSIN